MEVWIWANLRSDFLFMKNQKTNVSVADKIANMYSFMYQFEIEGPEMWKKFNRGKKEKLWFEQEVYNMASQSLNNPLVEHYAKLLEKFTALPE